MFCLYEKQNGELDAEKDARPKNHRKVSYMNPKLIATRSTMDSLFEKRSTKVWNRHIRRYRSLMETVAQCLLNRLFHKRDELELHLRTGRTLPVFSRNHSCLMMPKKRIYSNLRRFIKWEKMTNLDYNPIEKYLKCKELKRLGFSEEDIARIHERETRSNQRMVENSRIDGGIPPGIWL